MFSEILEKIFLKKHLIQIRKRITKKLCKKALQSLKVHCILFHLNSRHRRIQIEHLPFPRSFPSPWPRMLVKIEIERCCHFFLGRIYWRVVMPWVHLRERKLRKIIEWLCYFCISWRGLYTFWLKALPQSVKLYLLVSTFRFDRLWLFWLSRFYRGSTSWSTGTHYNYTVFFQRDQIATTIKTLPENQLKLEEVKKI